MTNFEKVGLFMKTFGQEVKSKPSFSNVSKKEIYNYCLKLKNEK